MIIVTACGQVRLFVLTALLTGLLFTLVAATFSGFVPASAVTALLEPGSRYTTLPIFLFGCAAIVAADARTRQARAGLPRERRLRTAAAAAALVAVLVGGWVADFRYPTSRSQTRHWAPIIAAAGCTTASSRAPGRSPRTARARITASRSRARTCGADRAQIGARARELPALGGLGDPVLPRARLRLPGSGRAAVTPCYGFIADRRLPE